jgi:5'-3' exonuclease
MRNEINYEEITVEKVIKNSPDRYDNTERVLLIDTDSLLYICTYFKEKDLEFYPTKELQLEEVKYRIRNKLQEIQNNVELWYNIKQTFLFVGGGNNFRYKLFKKYKDKRPQEKPEFFYEAKDYLLELGAVPSVGCEVDDMIYEASLIANENCIISTIDKDLLYWIPEFSVC